MGFLPKILLRSVSNLRNVHHIHNRHHIFEPAAAAAAATANNDSSSKHRLLLRRLHWSGLDETNIFSHLSPENFTSPTKLLSLLTDYFDSRQNPYFCGAATRYFSALSPHNNFSPLKSPLINPKLDDCFLVGSCDGLVCLDNAFGKAVIWNPTTNEVKLLPESKIDRPDPAEALPLTITTFTGESGFGFDSKSQDYKYVRWVGFFFEDEDEILRDSYSSIELYSLKTDSWKGTRYPTERAFSKKASAGVNGHFYWSIDAPTPTRVMWFDFSTENFSYFPFPCTLKRMGDTHTHSLFDFGGRLAAVMYAYPKQKIERKFEIWAWNEGWWSLEFDDYIAGAREPLGFSKDGRFLFLSGIDRRLVVYDVLTKKVNKVDVYCNPHELAVVPYVESAYPLNGESAAAAPPPGAAT